MLTFAALPLELIATTAIAPSTFLNAAVLSPDGNPDVATRIAPGLTYRDQFANAHSRRLTSYVFVVLSTLISFSLVFGFGHCTPSHQR